MRGEFDSCFSGDFTSVGGVFISGGGGGLGSRILSLRSFGNL